MTMLQLSEHRRSAPVALTLPQQQQLKDWFQASLEPAADGKVVVIPGSRVGGAELDGLNVTVQPKLPIHRVLSIIAESVDPYSWLDLDMRVGVNWSFEDALAALFVRACQQTFARGLHRSYRRERQELGYVRGKILIPQTIRRPTPVPISVEADVFDEDVVENQVLASTLQRIRITPSISADVRAAAHREWRQVRHVIELREPLRAADEIVWNRHNRRYEQAITLARLLLSAGSVTLEGRDEAVPGFVVNMPAVIEQWVRVQLRRAWSLSNFEMRDSWKGQLWLDQRRRISLQPDLAVRRDGAWRFVGDVKYKLLDTGGPNRDDIYQLLAYLTATGLREGTLVHANEMTSDESFFVENGGQRIRVVSVDLTRDDAASRLRALASTLISHRH